MPVALYRFLSIPKGFSYLNERGYVTKQLEKWHKVIFCWISFSLYVFILENKFENFEIKVKYLNIHMKSGLKILLLIYIHTYPFFKLQLFYSVNCWFCMFSVEILLSALTYCIICQPYLPSSFLLFWVPFTALLNWNSFPNWRL